MENKRLKAKDFGEEFAWGVSASALQTEGAHNVNGKGPSIWDEFADKNQIKGKQNHYVAANFYHQFREDIALIKEMGIPNFRFSLSWPRILPDGIGRINQDGIDFYHQVIDHCLANGIEPWITLYHWDLPLLLEKKGGWTNREILTWFEEYVEVCIKAFGGKVRHWMVLNEPLVFTGAGYFAGLHAPGKKGIGNFLKAAHHAALCQAIGFRTIKKLQPSAIVGTTFSCTQVTPVDYSPSHVRAAKRMDALLNRFFIEPSLGLGYPINDLPTLKKMNKYILPGDKENLKADFDFIGVQVYTREVVSNSFFTPYLRAKLIPAKKRKVHHTRMEWEVYPNSIYEMIKHFSSYEGVKSVIITENGASFYDEPINGRVHDLERVHYLKSHLDNVHKALEENHKIKGYFVWSLTDNFEWAEGYEQRFGLIYIDYLTQERIIKDSGFWYRDFLK
ncbi:MAG: beta-glucosidase [Bacteroidia bacterium]|nr:beta-glucosidase [Bacteroidia bacterium]MCF8447050.1 beta-glucosidase [Bacteroidia bacterium]